MPAAAQANADPGIDLLLADVSGITALGRNGLFPNGISGCAFQTTACNQGTDPIPWRAVMDPDHPFIAYIVARELDGRFTQISDRSFVKHSFFALSFTFCGSCTPTPGETLGLGCSDTYLAPTNGDNFWLGPPDEIDPWLGAWDPICSHFDRGEPPVAPPQDCNGVRSLTLTQANLLGDVAHRIRIRDSMFDVEGASFWYQGMYIVQAEGEATRGDNLGSRAFLPTWGGTRWEFADVGPMRHGSILQDWDGATLASATNGTDDGRLYVAVKVTGPSDGFYRYEYVVHNRDNARGVSALRIPVCAGARVRALGFSDVDSDGSNDWTSVSTVDELVFSTTTNPLRWNTLFNFWFESDAAPSAGALALDQALPGPGLPTVSVASQAPLGLYNVFLGPGCALDSPPTLCATGTPPRASLGNASFGVRSSGNAPLQPNMLYFSLVSGTSSFGGCDVYLGPRGTPVSLRATVLSDAAGVAVHSIPVPTDIALEGLSVSLQLAGRDPGGGALLSNFELSDGLLVRVGSAVPDCP